MADLNRILSDHGVQVRVKGTKENRVNGTLAGEFFGASSRSGQRWASEGPPKAVAMVLIAVGKDRKKLFRLARSCNNS